MATPPEVYPEPDITSPEVPGDITSPVVVGLVLAQYWGQETQGPRGSSSGPWPPSRLRACCPLPLSPRLVGDSFVQPQASHLSSV